MVDQEEFSAALIYDGACGLCTAAARWVARRDAARRLRLVPYQSAHLPSLAPHLTSEACRRAVQWVHMDGRHCSGAQAVFEALRSLPGVWGVIGVVGTIPAVGLLAEPVYRLAAAHRSRLSRWLGLTACAFPATEDSWPR